MSSHAHHSQHGGRHADLTWSTAISATLHSLTGWGDAASIALAVGLAFVFGYSLTMAPLLRAGLALGAAIPVALAADTISIAVMEIVDNAVLLLYPGAMDAGLDSFLFWGALALALAVAFVITVPVNRWMISRGKGHAVVHEYHGH